MANKSHGSLSLLEINFINYEHAQIEEGQWAGQFEQHHSAIPGFSSNGATAIQLHPSFSKVAVDDCGDESAEVEVICFDVAKVIFDSVEVITDSVADLAAVELLCVVDALFMDESLSTLLLCMRMSAQLTNRSCLPYPIPQPTSSQPQLFP